MLDFGMCRRILGLRFSRPPVPSTRRTGTSTGELNTSRLRPHSMTSSGRGVAQRASQRQEEEEGRNRHEPTRADLQIERRPKLRKQQWRLGSAWKASGSSFAARMAPSRIQAAESLLRPLPNAKGQAGANSNFLQQATADADRSGPFEGLQGSLVQSFQVWRASGSTSSQLQTQLYAYVKSRLHRKSGVGANPCTATAIHEGVTARLRQSGFLSTILYSFQKLECTLAEMYG